MNDLSDLEADLAIANATIAELEKTIKKQESIIFGLNVVIEFLRKKNAELEKAKRWIPVSEKLPELPDGNYCQIECNVIADGNKPFSTTMYYKRSTVRGKMVERWIWHDQISPWKVTHWLPLPQSPKKGE